MVVLFYVVTLGGGALLLALGFFTIYLGRRRGRSKNDASVLSAVLLVAGSLLLFAALLPLRDQH